MEIPCFPPARAVPAGALALAIAALLDAEREQAVAKSGFAGDPFGNASGWRLNGAWKRMISFTDEYSAATDAKGYQVGVTYQADGWLLDVRDMQVPMKLNRVDGAELSVTLGVTSLHGAVRRDGELFHVFSGGRHFVLHYNDPLAHAGEAEAAGGRLTAPMPGKVVAVLVQNGQDVKKGDALVIMEAMKMEHTIAAPSDGKVEELLYAVGDQVADGAPLLAFAAA